MITISRGFVMEFVSLDSIATHSHAFALFVMYLFVRYYRAAKVVDPVLTKGDDSDSGFSEAKSAAKSFVKPELRASVSYGKEQERDNDDASTSSSSSSVSFKPEEGRLDIDYSASLMEKSSSMEFESTLNERRRFLIGSKGDVAEATKRLNHYLRWNSEHVKARIDNGIKIKPTRDRDYDLWVESCLTAMKMNGEVENIVLPRIVRKICRKGNGNDGYAELRDRKGYRIFCLRPALMDTRLAKALTYTLAVAIYLDRSADREGSEKVTLVLDVRAGRGWPNTHVLRLIPFMKHSIQILLPLFTERLHRMLLYPVPGAFLHIWRMISKYMDPLTAQRVRVLEGRCKIEAPPPTEKLKVYIGEEALDQLEACRVDNFKA
jgi:hypothetical protein